MYKLIEEFLQFCLENGRIPMDYVKSPEFSVLLEKSQITKEPCYEELFYCRHEDLQITQSRLEARRYYENDHLFATGEPHGSTLNTKIDLDLRQGYKKFKVLNRNSLDLDNVKGTKYIALQEFEKERNHKVMANIISSRHTLLDLLHLPFQRNSITHNVVAFDGQIFMEAEQRPQRRVDASTMTGYNFEEIMTRDESANLNKWEFHPPRSNAIKYNSIVNHTFGKQDLSVLVSCEIDAVKQKPEDFRLNFDDTLFKYKILENNIEMKCRRLGGRNNLIKAILQCYLAGTNDLVVGYRDDNFHLKHIKKLDVQKLMDSSQSPLLNRDFLDKWFYFVTQFIRKSVKMPNNLSIHHHQLTFDKNNNEIILRSFRLNSYRLEKTVINKFIKWRRYLSSVQTNNNFLEEDKIASKSKKNRRRRRNNTKEHDQTITSISTTKDNKLYVDMDNSSDSITEDLKQMSLT